MFTDSIRLHTMLTVSVLVLEWMLYFSLFLIEGSLLQNCGARHDQESTFTACLKNLGRRKSSTLPGSVLRSHKLPEPAGCASRILVRLVSDLQLAHYRHEEDALGVRLGNTFLAEVIESRRNMLFDRGKVIPGLTLKSHSKN